MRVALTLDWWMGSTSLKVLVKNMFRELGKLMNEKRTFTIAGIRTDTIGIGDINQHFDCVHIPNMGGYRFPNLSALSCKNLILGPSGIDEVVLGRKVFKTEKEWNYFKPIIEKEVAKWHKHIDKIKAVHVVTNSEKEQMMKYLKVPEEKIFIIPHGVDHDIFKPPINKEESRRNILSKFFLKGVPYFIHVSESNWARKNIIRLLEAFKKAKDKGIVHNLIIVGKNDPIVYKKANEISGVKVLGFVSDEHLVELLQGADALLLPSIHEGFGLPIVEAMACEVPVLTSNTFSCPEVAADGGILVDPYDVTEITNKIQELSKNSKLRETLAKKALERSQNFSWRKTAEGLLELYESVNKGNDSNFNDDYDLAAYRTLTTITEISPLIHTAVPDLLEFDYTRIIDWSLGVGIENKDMKDFLIPFKNWLRIHKMKN